MKKAPKVLYFIRGSMPTEEQVEEAESFGIPVSYRNVEFYEEGMTLEECEGVAGDVPEAYAEAYPTAEKAIADYKAGKKAASKKADADPKATAKPAAKPAAASPAPAAAPAAGNGAPGWQAGR